MLHDLRKYQKNIRLGLSASWEPLGGSPERPEVRTRDRRFGGRPPSGNQRPKTLDGQYLYVSILLKIHYGHLDHDQIDSSEGLALRHHGSYSVALPSPLREKVRKIRRAVVFVMPKGEASTNFSS